jgi:hypothetical protein
MRANETCSTNNNEFFIYDFHEDFLWVDYFVKF